jgi:hypothetical protein
MRDRAPLAIEGRCVWLTDAFPARRTGKLLPGIAAETAVFAPPRAAAISSKSLI